MRFKCIAIHYMEYIMHLSRSRLLYKGIGIFFQPEIIVHVGGRASAQFLQQIHYFITSTKIKGTIHQDNKWIYQTIDQWAKILGYSTSTIKNCIRILQNLNLIKVEKLSNYKSNRTNFYTINYGVLNEVLKVEPNSQSDEYIRVWCINRQKGRNMIYNIYFE